MQGEPMFKTRAGALVVASLLALTGCTSARYISMEPDGGVVAIPSNTNTWPNFYRDQAVELIKKRCPDYVLVHEEEVVTGQTTHSNTNTDKTGNPTMAALGVSPVRENVNTTTYATNQTEWRIYFRKAGAAQAVQAVTPLPTPERTTGLRVPAPPTPIAISGN
jgi:hypothetical protein